MVFGSGVVGYGVKIVVREEGVDFLDVVLGVCDDSSFSFVCACDQCITLFDFQMYLFEDV
jgi:hypothetical protein